MQIEIWQMLPPPPGVAGEGTTTPNQLESLPPTGEIPGPPSGPFFGEARMATFTGADAQAMAAQAAVRLALDFGQRHLVICRRENPEASRETLAEIRFEY